MNNSILAESLDKGLLGSEFWNLLNRRANTKKKRLEVLVRFSPMICIVCCSLYHPLARDI